MCACKKEDQDRSLCDSVEPARGLLILACIMVIFGCLLIIAKNYEPTSTAYACFDKEKNPVEVQNLCKRLTKNQWWGAYYGGKK